MAHENPEKVVRICQTFSVDTLIIGNLLGNL